MRKETCANCKYVFTGLVSNNLWCRRYPPRGYSPDNIDHFPRTHKNLWCGEYKGKEDDD